MYLHKETAAQMFNVPLELITFCSKHLSAILLEPCIDIPLKA